MKASKLFHISLHFHSSQKLFEKIQKKPHVGSRRGPILDITEYNVVLFKIIFMILNFEKLLRYLWPFFFFFKKMQAELLWQWRQLAWILEDLGMRLGRR